MNKMRLVGVEKTTEQIVAITIDRLPPQFSMEEVIFRCNPHNTTQLVEEIIANAYAHQGREKILKVVPAVPIALHTLLL